jgi:hypothetical protein
MLEKGTHTTRDTLTPDVRKMKYKNLVVCFNVILFYVKVSAIKEV